ncbi:MAG: SDR family oxidoreductase [Alsobacter sp.]
MPAPAPTHLTVLVTGASSGIGRAVALRLASDGHRVIGLARNANSLRELEAKAGIVPLAADVTDLAGVADTLRSHEPDVVIHNAGLLSTRGPFQAIEPAAIDTHLDVNLRAPLHLTRLVLPGMIERRRGHVVFVTSIAARAAHPDIALYATTKAALAHFSDSLRLDLQGTGIRVTDLAPGRVRTDLYRDALTETGRKQLYEGFRSLEPEDVAAAVSYVLSLPPHVDVARLELYPTEQAHGGSRMVSPG